MEFLRSEKGNDWYMLYYRTDDGQDGAVKIIGGLLDWFHQAGIDFNEFTKAKYDKGAEKYRIDGKGVKVHLMRGQYGLQVEGLLIGCHWTGRRKVSSLQPGDLIYAQRTVKEVVKYRAKAYPRPYIEFKNHVSSAETPDTWLTVVTGIETDEELLIAS